VKLNINILIDETNARCDRILDELETAAAEGEGISISVGSTRFQADLIDVAEAP
jgi:hypothetical protein